MQDEIKINSLKAYLGFISLNKSKFILICVSIVFLIPLSLMLLVLIPFLIKSINSTPSDISWNDMIGQRLTDLISPIISGTKYQTGIDLYTQQHTLPFIILIIALAYMILSFLNDFWLRDFGELIAKKLRQDIALKYLSLNYEHARTFDPALLSNMTGVDSKEAQTAFTRLVNSFFKEGIIAIIFLTWLILLDPRLFALFISILIPAGIALRTTSKVLKKLVKQGLASEVELLNGLLERMKGWQTIKVFKTIDFEIKNFAKINARIFTIWRRSARARALGSPLVEFLGICAASCVVIIAFRRIVQGELTNSVFISFIVTIGFLVDKVTRIVDQINESKKGLEGLKRILKFTQTTPETSAFDQHIKNDDAEKKLIVNSIELSNLSVATPSGKVLAHNISGSFKQGQIIAIIGPSGIGKSTFLNVLLGLEKPVSGNVLINSEPCNEKTFRALSETLGIIPQEPKIFQGSILDNILYPKLIENPTPEDINKALHALKLANLNHDLYSSTYGLSGGEKQRLMFARIFYSKPTLIIIDEGTSALDHSNELLLLNNLKNDLNKSIIFVVAHRPAVKNFAHSILNFANYSH